MREIGFFSETTTFAVTARWVLILALGLPASTVSADIKCWTNRDGVRECGDAVPAEYAQQGHEVKSNTGMTLKKQPRAKTREEVVRERAEKVIAARKRAETAAIARKQATADKVLLDTFGSEDDLLLARDGQLTNINSQIKLTESQIAKIQKSLDQLISKAADFERRNQKLPTELSLDMDKLRAQIAEQRAFVEAKLKEQAALRKKFDLDLARFQELSRAR